MKRRVGATIVIAVFCIACGRAAGLAWLSSLKTPAELSRIPPKILPESPTLATTGSYFLAVLSLSYFLNSLVIASLATLLSLAAGSLAAYRLIHLPARLGTNWPEVYWFSVSFRRSSFCFRFTNSCRRPEPSTIPGR